MKLYTIKKTQLVKRPLQEVFSFFSKPENLSLITPPEMNFCVFTPSPIVMKEGTIIDYSVTVFGFSTRWTSLITCYNPPHKFVDEQLKGPYSFWHHTHSFYETDDGTMIEDEVRYVLPFGFIGHFLHPLLVQPQLEKIFHYRKKVIEQLFQYENSKAHKINLLKGEIQ